MPASTGTETSRRVVDGDTVDVLDLEASTSEALRWLDHCRGVLTLHVRYSVHF